MSHVTLKGTPVKLAGTFPKPGDYINNFFLTKNDLNDISLDDFDQKFLILNIFISLDTPTCSTSIKRFNSAIADLPDCAVLCISKDLPFAFSRFCETNNTKSVITLSAFRNSDFGQQFGLEIIEGPLRGLLSRAVIILNNERQVIYTELVTEITADPDYDKALSVVANY